jgi:hypothetical protein
MWPGHDACETAVARHLSRVRYRAERDDLYQAAALRVLTYPHAPAGAAAHRGAQDFVRSLAQPEVVFAPTMPLAFDEAEISGRLATARRLAGGGGSRQWFLDAEAARAKQAQRTRKRAARTA